MNNDAMALSSQELSMSGLYLGKLIIAVLILALFSFPVLADDYAAKVRSAGVLARPDGFDIETEIEYRLSPTAKEALKKGVPLTWDIFIKINQIGWLFNTTLYEKKLGYTLQFHALLNQYEVRYPPAQLEMFLTLNAALNFMSMVHDVSYLDKNHFATNKHYQLAIKSQFNRESLPIPLRPFAYLDSQWFLSSVWYVWPIPK